MLLLLGLVIEDPRHEERLDNCNEDSNPVGEQPREVGHHQSRPNLSTAWYAFANS